MKIYNFTVRCLPVGFRFEKPHLTGSCDLALGLKVGVDLKQTEVPPVATHVQSLAIVPYDEVDAGKLDGVETFELSGAEVADIAEAVEELLSGWIEI